MKNILIIEDDLYIRNNIDKILKKQQFKTRTAGSAEEAERLLETGEVFDLFLIDVILPDGSGFDICKKLRETCVAPVIFLTACDDEESIVNGLDTGGDDYIVKPFRMGELLSRIQANLRRMDMNRENRECTKKRFAGGLVVDTDAHVIFRNGRSLSLTLLESDLLRVLTDNSGILMKRSVLLERLWDSAGNFVEDNTLTVAISRLKSKLAPAGSDEAYIETVRGAGYRWIGKPENEESEK